MIKETVYPGIDEYMTSFFNYFHRKEGRDLARNYVIGLIMDGERKSVEPMSEKVNAFERSMQRLLTEVKWDEQEVIREYRRVMLDKTSDPQGIIAVDDTSFPKKGRDSVCVSRQYCGRMGKVDNCQIGVSLTYVGQDVAWPYCMDLFVPKQWDDLENPDCHVRRKKTKMPETAHHKEKWRMALEQIDLARFDGVPHRAVVADSWYGNFADFRKGLVDRRESYVVGVYSDTEVFLEQPLLELAPPKKKKRGRPQKFSQVVNVNPQPVKVSDVGEKIAQDAWERLELLRDSKGKPLMVEAVSLRVWPATGYRQGNVNEEVSLIIEKRESESKEKELRYYFSNMPQCKPTIEMVRIFHERFWIEHGYQQLKEELGMDHHEGRSWIGWHRHVILVFLAYGYLTWIRLLEKKRKSQEAWKTWIMLQETAGREFFC
ncbi:MAG: IS701 family transposase [Desulfobacterales bacterium]